MGKMETENRKRGMGNGTKKWRDRVGLIPKDEITSNVQCILSKLKFRCIFVSEKNAWTFSQSCQRNTTKTNNCGRRRKWNYRT